VHARRGKPAAAPGAEEEDDPAAEAVGKEGPQVRVHAAAGSAQAAPALRLCLPHQGTFFSSQNLAKTDFFLTGFSFLWLS